jgi:uncharacterized protein (TIGR02246 family)
MSGIEDRLQAIEDREDIRELTARYCHAIAAADVAGIVGLFCEDGSFCINDQVTTGTAALTEFYSTTLAGTPPMPFIQNHVIDELNESEARARCSAEIRLIQNGEAVTGAGWYTDTFRRVDGQWKFLTRKFHTFHMVPLRKGWAGASTD